MELHAPMKDLPATEMIATGKRQALKKFSVPFDVTGLLPPLVSDYLEGAPSVRSLHKIPLHADVLAASLGGTRIPAASRKALAEILRRQYAGFPDASMDAVRRNIALLERENTWTVTTGHQLNLFTGPLYVIYKLASAIHLAVSLKSLRPDMDFVPVYWMAGEDHDFEEINHINLYGRKFEWKEGQGGAAGRMRCAGFATLIDEIEAAMDKTPEAAHILALLRRAYADGNSLALATRTLVHELFAKYGLVILDPDDPELKSGFAEIMIDDALNHTAYQKVSEAIGTIEPKYKVQVHPREINLFYLDTNFRGRVERKDDGYVVLGLDKKFSKEGLETAIREHPERFSPNVVLRPLYQETVLPNAAVIGGPAELSYWLEYKSMFEHYNVPFPCLALRGMVLVLDSAIANRMEKLGLAKEELFKPSDVLVKEFIARNSDTGFFETMRQRVTELFDSLAGKIAAIDPTLKASAEGEKQKSLKSVTQLEEKAIKALKRKHDTAVGQVEKLKAALFPGGVLQERVESFLPVYARHGQGFIEALVAGLDPLEKKFFVFSEG